MSYGLLVKDHNNNTIIGPDTFTVRMVDARLSGVGMMSPGQGVYLPMSNKVKAGMFAIVMPLKQYQTGYMPKYRGYRDYQPKIVSTPSATVHDGYIILRSVNLRDAVTDGSAAIYVFTNV